MEETSQPEKPESEYLNPNEEQGGIRRRLRDRDLLRKRKAEAEEKDQWVFGVESQRKRSRAEDKSGTKRRGRPRKSEPQISAAQEEAAVSQEAAGGTPDQIPAPLTPLSALESQSVSVLAAPVAPAVLTFPPVTVAPVAPVAPAPVTVAPVAPVTVAPVAPVAPVVPVAPVAPPPVIESVRIFGPPLTSPAPVKPAPDVDPGSVQDSAPAPESVSAPVLSQDTDPAPPPPSAPPQVETLYTEPQGREALDQVLIEDLGPDEEDDIPTSQDKRADEDLSESLSTTINVSEQNKMYSIPSLASLQQEYLPGNQL